VKIFNKFIGKIIFFILINFTNIINASSSLNLLSEKKNLYIIDNFRQEIFKHNDIIITHGDLLKRITSTRNLNAKIIKVDSTLEIGLKRVIDDINNGYRVDGVISSIPGRNFSYVELENLFDYPIIINSKTLADQKKLIKERILSISDFCGDSQCSGRKFNKFYKVSIAATIIKRIEQITKNKIPIVVAYGNPDLDRYGNSRDVNILALANGVKAFAGGDENGNLLKDYPYSDLAGGVKRAIFEVRLIQDSLNGSFFGIDFNEDGKSEFILEKHDFKLDVPYVIGYIEGTSLIPPNVIEDFLEIKDKVYYSKKAQEAQGTDI
jgi:hypothetical protein